MITHFQNIEVTRLIPGKGFAAKETFEKRDGSQGAQYVTVWFGNEAPSLQVGDIVSGSGFTSVRTNNYTDKSGEQRTSYDLTLNSARIEDVQEGLAPATGEEPPF